MPYPLSITSATDLSSTSPFSVALTTAKAILTSLGYEDLQPGMYAAEQAYQTQRQSLLQALRFYADDPRDVGHQQRLSVLLEGSIQELQREIARLHLQREKYQLEAKLEPSRATNDSYLSQAKSWVLGQVKYFFGSTASQQTEKYAELISKRETLVKQSQGLWSELDALMQVPMPVRASSRRLLQTGQTIADRCFPTGVCDLSSLADGYGGFMLQGEAAGDWSGFPVHSAGDINGDGVDDLVVGAGLADSQGKVDAGKSYVIFGSRNVGAWGSGVLNLSSLMDGIHGFVLLGEAAGDWSGYAVASAGDINDDGVGDLVVGAYLADVVGRNESGRSYVIFGSRNASAWGSGVLNLGSLMDGVHGFVLLGEATSDQSGRAVATVGDINDDGIDDLVIGGPYASPYGKANAGKIYVVFGNRNATAWGTGIFNISSLMNGIRGFVLAGDLAGDGSGYSVSGIGDLNDDGIADLAVGASGATVGGQQLGKTYVIFGNRSASAWGAGMLNLSSLMDGVRGFVLQGGEAAANFGFFVSGGGDLNGDEVVDLVVGTYFPDVSGQLDAGKCYVVFGSPNVSAWGTGILNISNRMDGIRGFMLQGEMAGDQFGISVSCTGDINGDGMADLVVAANKADTLDRTNVGKNYVVFGNRNVNAWGTGTLNASSLMDGVRGFVLQGDGADDRIGRSVSSASDMNGDGVKDIVLGGNLGDVPGQPDAGKSYVVWGNLIPTLVNNTLTIHDSETLVLTTALLASFDDYTRSSELLYNTSIIQHGQFAFTSTPSVAITQFFQGNVSAGLIQFTHNGSAIAPSYAVSVSDGIRATAPVVVNVTFYRYPTFGLESYDLPEGATITLSSGLLPVVEDYPDDQVLFQVSNISYGQFILTPPGTTNISQFSRAQLVAGQVSFQHDGSELAPTYSLSLQDPYFTLSAVASNITLIPVNDPPILVQNRLSILQGQTVTFNSSNLFALDPDNSEDELSYYVSNIQRGVFFSSTPLSPLYSFTQGNISRGEIQFIHDNSAFPPYYQVTVSDGALSTPLQTVIVTFNGVNHPPLLLTAVLSVSEGQSVVLTPSQFAASDTDTPSEQVTFLISNITHGRFEFYSIPGVGLDQFSMQDIQQNTIRFVHDGSEVAPTFTVAVTDGVSTTASRPAIVSYTPVNNTPVLVNNTLALSEGGTVTLTSTFLSATDRDNPAGSLLFLPTQVQQGRFELVSNAGRSLTSFSQQQVTDGQVRFIHDGGEVAPSYQMAVSDGLLSSPPQAVAVDYTPINDAPRIVLNQLAIAEGGSAVLSSSQLLIEDPDSSSTQLLITPSAIQAGQFEQVFNPGISLTNFNYQNVQTGFIRFVHNGSEVPAAYTLTVNDGNLSSAPVGAVITYTPVNDAPVLTRNRLTLSEGDTLTLSSDDLAATDSDDVPEGLLFTVSQLQQGRFTDTMTGASILSFNQQALDSGQINFTHDGSQAAPTYFISVSDGRLASPAQSVLVNFTAINDAPSIVVNQLSITQGQAVLLDSGDLRATDEETPADDLLLTASQVKNGHFEYVADPGRPVSTFSQDKIRKADIRFVSDGSSRPPSYVFEVSDGQLDSTLSNATINFNPVPATPTPSGLSTQEIVSLLSTLGSVGLTIAGYLWWRNKTAEHRRGHDFANHLRKLLNLEYYDFTKGAGDVYKLKVNNLIRQINSRHDDFYAHLTDEQRQAFALCVAGLMVQKELLARSGNASGLFNWWLCFSMGWSNQLKLKEMDKAATAIGDAAVTAWKAETRPLERWSYKPRGAREKIGMFFAASNCTSSRPQSGMLAEVHRASEYKSRSAETVGAMEAGEGVELDTLRSPSPIPAGIIGRGSGFFDRSEGMALRHELEMQKQKSEKQEQQLTAIHEKLDSVLVHLAQPR